MRLSRRGQAVVEYMLLMCAMVTVASVVAYFLRGYIDQLVEKIGDRILDAILTIAFS